MKKKSESKEIMIKDMEPCDNRPLRTFTHDLTGQISDRGRERIIQAMMRINKPRTSTFDIDWKEVEATTTEINNVLIEEGLMKKPKKERVASTE